jgi:hypothetical protein
MGTDKNRSLQKDRLAVGAYKATHRSGEENGRLAGLEEDHSKSTGFTLSPISSRSDFLDH